MTISETTPKPDITESTCQLAPCPFCGGEAEVEAYGTHLRSHNIRCTQCMCSFETGEVGDFRGRMWNQRHNPAVDKIKTIIAELKTTMAHNASYDGCNPTLAINNTAMGALELCLRIVGGKMTDYSKLTDEEINALVVNTFDDKQMADLTWMGNGTLLLNRFIFYVLETHHVCLKRNSKIGDMPEDVLWCAYTEVYNIFVWVGSCAAVCKNLKRAILECYLKIVDIKQAVGA